MIKRLLLALLIAWGAAPAQASYMGSGSSGAVTLSGDTSGPSTATVTSKLNGVTPGGSCSAGQFVSSVSASGVPTCGALPASGIPYPSSGFLTSEGTYPTTLTMAATRMYCTAARYRPGLTIPALWTVTTSNISGGNISLAIYSDYADGSSNHRPYQLQASVSGLSLTNATAGVIGTLASPWTPTPNTLYWQCVWSDSAAIAMATSPLNFYQLVGETSISKPPIGLTNALNGYYTTMTYSTTWPSDLSTVTGASWVQVISAIPIVGFKAQ